MGLAPSTDCESLQGCQGPPSLATTITKPALVFVWPCFAHADTFLEEDPREVERARDQEMLTQYRRLREGLSGTGIEVLKASGAVHMDFASAKGRAEKVRTTTVEWRGVLVFCPGRKVKKIKMAQAILLDRDIVGALGGCAPASGGPTSAVRPK